MVHVGGLCWYHKDRSRKGYQRLINEDLDLDYYTTRRGDKPISGNIKHYTREGVREDTREGVREDTREGSREDTREGAREDTREWVRENTREGVRENTREGAREDTREGGKGEPFSQAIQGDFPSGAGESHTSPLQSQQLDHSLAPDASTGRGLTHTIVSYWRKRMSTFSGHDNAPMYSKLKDASSGRSSEDKCVDQSLLTSKPEVSQFPKLDIMHTSTPTCNSPSIIPIPSVFSVQSTSSEKVKTSQTLKEEGISRSEFMSVPELATPGLTSSEFVSADGEADSLPQLKKYTIFKSDIYDKLKFHPYSVVKVSENAELLEHVQSEQSQWAYDLAVMYNRQFNGGSEGSADSAELGSMARELSNELIDIMSSKSSSTLHTSDNSKRTETFSDTQDFPVVSKGHPADHLESVLSSSNCLPPLTCSRVISTTSRTPNACELCVIPLDSQDSDPSTGPHHVRSPSSSSDGSVHSTCGLLPNTPHPSPVHGTSSEDEPECDVTQFSLHGPPSGDILLQ